MDLRYWKKMQKKTLWLEVMCKVAQVQKYIYIYYLDIYTCMYSISIQLGGSKTSLANRKVLIQLRFFFAQGGINKHHRSEDTI